MVENTATRRLYMYDADWTATWWKRHRSWQVCRCDTQWTTVTRGQTIIPVFGFNQRRLLRWSQRESTHNLCALLVQQNGLCNFTCNLESTRIPEFLVFYCTVQVSWSLTSLFSTNMAISETILYCAKTGSSVQHDAGLVTFWGYHFNHPSI